MQLYRVLSMSAPQCKGNSMARLCLSWKQYLAGTSCLLLRFPSLAITNRPSWWKSISMTGKRKPSSPSLGCCIRFPNLNTKAARKPAFPSKGWYLHTAAAHTEVTRPWGNKILSAHSDTVTTASKYKIRPGTFHALRLFMVGLHLMQSLKALDHGKN